MQVPRTIQKLALMFGMTAGVSLLIVISEILHRHVFDIAPMVKPWEEFLYVFVFAAVLSFSRWAIIKLCAALFLFLSLIVNPVHFEVYQSWINGINYYLALTEWSEVANTGISMVPKLLPTILWGAVDLFLLGSLYKASVNLFPEHRIRRPVLDIIFIVLMGLICVRSFHTTQEHGISPKTSYGKLKSNYFSFGYFLGRVLPYKVFNLSSIQNYTCEAPARISEPKIDHIIFIMGESESAAHAGTFGYERDTTPFFSSVKGKSEFIVRPIHSAGFMTAVSLPTFFNAVPQPNGLAHIMKGTTNLFRLAKEQGFKTQWFTAQARNEMSILNLIGEKWIDHSTFPDAFGFPSESMPDAELLKPFDTLTQFDTRSFLVLHQRGSHTPYATLLPKDKANVFGDSIVDRYDATVLATDHFVKSVYERIQDRKLKNWLLIYTSDHGAFVTNKTYNQGTLQPDSYTVPLFITSDNQDVLNNLRQQFDHDKPAFHQQLSTSIIRLMGYDVAVPDGKAGVITGNMLTGDAGQLQYKDGAFEYVYP